MWIAKCRSRASGAVALLAPLSLNILLRWSRYVCGSGAAYFVDLRLADVLSFGLMLTWSCANGDHGSSVQGVHGRNRAPNPVHLSMGTSKLVTLRAD